MLNNKILYSLDDVAIQPCVTSMVNSRSECNVYCEDGMLPIFTAPMPSVINETMYENYTKNAINPIIPRTTGYSMRLELCERMFVGFSLKEFIEEFIENKKDLNKTYFVLIDMANGHLQSLFNSCSEAKSYYKKSLVLMVGNVANPETYRRFCDIGVDYCRCSVGSGSACTTATNTGTYYAMASLLDECNTIKNWFKHRNYSYTKIIADGGITNYRNIIKCLALGADYVMLGSALNSLEDSAGKIVLDKDNNRYKLYYGMASHQGQEDLGKDIGTPEGKMLHNPIKGTIKQFVDDFILYLQSSMTYCGIKDIKDFIGKPTLNILSPNAAKQFNQQQ